MDNQNDQIKEQQNPQRTNQIVTQQKQKTLSQRLLASSSQSLPKHESNVQEQSLEDNCRDNINDKDDDDIKNKQNDKANDTLHITIPKGLNSEYPKARQSTLPVRYKYCCKQCKHTERDKKACVCVVPLGQRRTLLGSMGCQTCGCLGCSREDFLSRGENPEYKPGEKKFTNEQHQDNRHSCCYKCSKAYSKFNKTCLCQLPYQSRKAKLPSSGCKICGCSGCNPDDLKKGHHRQGSRSRSRRKKNQKKLGRQKEEDSRHSHQIIDTANMNLYNVDKSVIGSMIMGQYNLPTYLLGFGVPQRTQSYILGHPK